MQPLKTEPAWEDAQFSILCDDERCADLMLALRSLPEQDALKAAKALAFEACSRSQLKTAGMLALSFGAFDAADANGRSACSCLLLLGHAQTAAFFIELGHKPWEPPPARQAPAQAENGGILCQMVLLARDHGLPLPGALELKKNITDLADIEPDPAGLAAESQALLLLAAKLPEPYQAACKYLSFLAATLSCASDMLPKLLPGSV